MATPIRANTVPCYETERIQLNQCLTLEVNFVSPIPMIASFQVRDIIIHRIVYAPFDRVLFTSVPFDRVLFTSMHRSVDTKRNVCHTPSMKTAISLSKRIKQKESTEKRVRKFVVRFGRVPKLGGICHFPQLMNGVNHPTTILPWVFQSMILG